MLYFLKDFDYILLSYKIFIHILIRNRDLDIFQWKVRAVLSVVKQLQYHSVVSR